MITPGTVAQLAIVVTVTVVTFLLMGAASMGKKMPALRRLAPIEAMKEAIGRAAETGKPLIFNNGYGGLLNASYSVQTLAGIDILSHISKETAKWDMPVIVPLCMSVTMPLVVDTMYESYLSAGHPERFKKFVDVRYLSDEQWPWVTGSVGIVQREKPAAIMLMGFFWGDSLIQTEAGYVAGAIQIGGTSQMETMAYFAATCDYFLLGEELFAAAAYVRDDPVQTSTVISEDVIKIIFLAVLLAGIALMYAGSNAIVKLLMS